VPPRLRGDWTTWPDVRTQLRRRWERGTFLAAHAAGLPFEPLDLPIRRPWPRDIGDRFDEVRAWRDGWTAVPRGIRVVETPVGGRLIGVNQLPARVVIDTWANLLLVLGVRREVETFDAQLAAAHERAPALVDWMTAHPMQVLAAGDGWDMLVTTVLWIDTEARPGSYVREIDVPGVDTKFIETNRGLLTDLLERQLTPHRLDLTRPRSDFAGRHGFRSKPDYVRMRLPPQHVSSFSEFAVRVEELAATPVAGDTVVVVENEITYLAMPSRPGTAIVLGGGYAVGRLAPLRWLAERDLRYWGDIDTHGFAILHRLRGSFPHTCSLLMDRGTLLAHPTQWVRESSPTREQLDRLTADETDLYTDLVTDALGESVRLEQERVRLSLVDAALPVRRETRQ